MGATHRAAEGAGTAVRHLHLSVSGSSCFQQKDSGHQETAPERYTKHVPNKSFFQSFKIQYPKLLFI